LKQTFSSGNGFKEFDALDFSGFLLLDCSDIVFIFVAHFTAAV
jgi:hypothetical protein